MQNDLLFGGVSIAGIGDFLQLPPVNAYTVYSVLHRVGYKVFNKPLWSNFFLHELVQIVRQSSDPQFAQLLNRVREGKHTDDDLKEIQKLADVDTTHWPHQYLTLYMTNYMAGLYNEACLAKINSEKVVIIAQDSKKDTQTNRYSVTVPENASLTNTANLTKTLKVCVGARIMLLHNLDVSEKLANGSMGVVHRLHINRRNPLLGEIYIKFDDPDAGNSKKNPLLRDAELKQCVPIKAITRGFGVKRGIKTVDVQRKQYPFIIAHAGTVHKAQGQTLNYMKGDLDTSTGKTRPCPVAPGLFYTMLSRAKSRSGVKLLNFTPDKIKVNQKAVAEMERMRTECLFSWTHPLLNITGGSIALLNIVSWNAHIQHFLADKMYINHNALFCFTETKLDGRSFQHIQDHDEVEEWADIHKTTGHGLAICYNTNKVKIIQVFETNSTLEILPVLMDICNETVLVVLLYRPPGPIGTFIMDLMTQVSILPTQYRILILGDFNLDQLLDQNVGRIHPILTTFTLHQRSNYTTHIDGGILDLVLDSNSTQDVEWMPSPYSDHFVLLVQL